MSCACCGALGLVCRFWWSYRTFDDAICTTCRNWATDCLRSQQEGLHPGISLNKEQE